MAEYQLRCFAQSGNAYKVALMLALAGADWEPVFVDFFNGETHTPAYREINEMGEAPVLDHGDLRLSQSGVILDYLSQRFRDFGPKSEAERREILRWTLWDNHKLTSYIATLRYQTKFLPDDQRQPEVMDFLTRRSATALGILDRHLFNRAWIAADHLTTADLSCVGYLYYDHEFPHDLATFPNVDRWRQAIAALPGWKHPYDLMPGYPIPPGALS
jgi:glutathione S-transferase